MEKIWIGIAILAVVIEIATLGLTTLWFAIGAVAAALSAKFGLGVTDQFVVFGVVSLTTLFFTRPLFKKYLMKTTTKTNVEALIGKEVKVTETIDNISSGLIILNGVEWTAKSKIEEKIEKDLVVEIVEVVGNTVFVRSKSADK